MYRREYRTTGWSLWACIGHVVGLHRGLQLQTAHCADYDRAPLGFFAGISKVLTIDASATTGAFLENNSAVASLPETKDRFTPPNRLFLSYTPWTRKTCMF